MGQVIDELYFNQLPTDLFRHGSTKGPRLDKPRTMPPRQLGQKYDIRIYEKDGVEWVESNSGGISLFNKPDPRFGDRWWRLAKGTKIPEFLKISRDKSMNPLTEHIHYTIRPIHDMPLATFIVYLRKLSAFATPTFEVSPSSKVQ